MHIVHMYVDMCVSPVIVYNTPDRGRKTGNGGRLGGRVKENKGMKEGEGERGENQRGGISHTYNLSLIQYTPGQEMA